VLADMVVDERRARRRLCVRAGLGRGCSLLRRAFRRSSEGRSAEQARFVLSEANFRTAQCTVKSVAAALGMVV